MGRYAMEQNVKRLAEIVAGDERTQADHAEAVGLAFGLLGVVAIAVVRIADALEASQKA